MSFSKADVVLLPIPITDLSSRKVRPAIVIGNSSHPGDLFLVPVSSQLGNVEMALQDWRAAGLHVPCGVKPQIATVEQRLIVKRVGTLSQLDRGALDARIRVWLQL